jgi:hypothetical protein
MISALCRSGQTDSGGWRRRGRFQSEGIPFDRVLDAGGAGAVLDEPLPLGRTGMPLLLLLRRDATENDRFHGD